MLKQRYDRYIFDAYLAVGKLKAVLKPFQDLDDEDLGEEAGQDNGWKHLASPVSGESKEMDEQGQARDTERLHRGASKRINESKLLEEESKLSTLKDALRDVNNKIADESEKAEKEARVRLG